MIKPLFSKLDSNYNTNSKSIHSCTMSFSDTSAIRMCEALQTTDNQFLDEFKKSTKKKCPHGYIIDAKDLASILALPHIFGVRTHSWNAQKNGNPPRDAIGKQGVIFYMDIPYHNSPAHIDLWDKNTPVGDEFWEAKTIWLWTLL